MRDTKRDKKIDKLFQFEVGKSVERDATTSFIVTTERESYVGCCLA